MITKEQLMESMTRECDIAIHLFTKLSPESYDYQPSAEQRTTLWLLRYLAVCATAGIACMQAGNWGVFREFSERVKEMPAADFPAEMTRQKEELQRFFAETSEEELRTREVPMPGGAIVPFGVAILNGPFKWLAAYKMQLFLYAKATGATELRTSNLWRGTDPKPAV
jgi:hypothetical protein